MNRIISMDKFCWVFVVALFMLYGSALAQTSTSQSTSAEEMVACTQEAKLCPDGSYVGRTGPNCEFAQCPSEAEPVLASGVVGESFVLDGSKSSDDGIISSFKWRQVGGPFKFETQEGRILSIVPPVAGTYEFEFVATRDDGNSSVAQTLQLEVHSKATDGDPDRPVTTGEVPNPDTTKTNPGERVMQPEFGTDSADTDSTSQHNQTDLEFLSEGASNVSVSKVQVRGWDPEKKREFLGSVKTHAELRSGEDLKNFATGVLLADENVEELQITDDGIKMSYRMPAKLFGILSAPLRARAEIKNDGRVKVKFPWHSFLYKKYVDAGELSAQIATELGTDLDDWVALSAAGVAKTGGAISTTQEVLLRGYEKSHRLIRGN